VSEANTAEAGENCPPDDPLTERGQFPILRLAHGAVLLLAGALRVWRLDQNGFDNEYYAAAVRSMASSLHAFLYNSFDPAGFVSVDKPPVALWVQVASVKLFGFHGLSVLLPQALEGVAAVWLIHHLVLRRFGAPAGLLAALFLALTPVSVAVDRSGNPESCLVLVLLLAAWALTRASEEGHRGLLLLASALIGLGFNVKMLAAFVVVPTFALVYFLGAPVGWRRRVVDLALAGLVLVAASLPWVLAYDLTPAGHRPFVGSSKENSMVDLAIGHNGIGRFVKLARPSRTGGEGAWTTPSAAANPASGAVPPAGALIGGARVFVRSPVGPLRLADGQLAAQVGWLFPLAVMGPVVGALQSRVRRRLAATDLSLILWAGWMLSYGIVYSYAGGIFHFYYLSALAPPLAALAGIGAMRLWTCYLEGGWRALLLPGTLTLTAASQVYVEATALGWRFGRSPSLSAVLIAAHGGEGDWRISLHVALLGGTLAAVACLLVMLLLERRGRLVRNLAGVALGVALLALLVIPMAWALSSVLVPGIPVLPAADVLRLDGHIITADLPVRGRSGIPASTAKLVGLLQSNRQGERYLLATSSTRLAAPIIIETGEPVMAMGGFHGLDPILSPEKLAHMVETRQLRFAMLGDLSVVSRRLGGEVALGPTADWIRAHGTLVDPALWRSTAEDDSAGEGGARTRGGDLASAPGHVEASRRLAQRRRAGRMELYDLRPDGGIISASSR
jgi:4-amino-4-deoxy-L-arabinose transferase-like glycosyltransferase